jgi:hypothetical protein
VEFEEQMDQKELAKKSKFTILKDGMKRLGLNPDDVDDKEEAVKAIYDKLLVDGKETEGCCPTCGAELPMVEACPFCGESLVDDVPKEEPQEAKKSKKSGRSKKDDKEEDPNRVAGTDLLAALIKEMEFPEEHVHYKKSRTSLWTDSGLIAKCFTQKWAVRLHVPFLLKNYSDEAQAILVDFEKPIKNMYARFTMNNLDDINLASTVLVETGKMKAVSNEEKLKEKKEKDAAKKAERDAKKDKDKEAKKAEREAKKAKRAEEKKAAREAKKAERDAKKAAEKNENKEE